jgi:putative proteasome-type protease
VVVVTFCIGLRVEDGLVALSDTRVLRGSEISTKSKLSTLVDGDGEAVVMTSGLRSIRDKVVARLEDDLRTAEAPHRRMHELATAYGEVLRAVRTEDEEALRSGGLNFNSHAILAGQFDDDDRPVLMHVYPEGNWVEATDDAPYVIVGRASSGKPILDRLLTVETTLDQALSLAYVAFDATRASASDVDFPVDVAVLARDSGRFVSRRYTSDDLGQVHDAWLDGLRAALDALPNEWARLLLPTPEQEPTP